MTDDSDVDPGETLIATLSTASTGTISTTPATMTIGDDDTYGLSIAKTTDAAEPGTNGVFTVTVTPAIPADGAAITGTVTWGGTATSDDHGTLPTTFSIAAGSSAGTITVPVTDDSDVDPGETLIATLSTASTGTISTTPATMTIGDDDVLAADSATITIDDATIPNGDTTVGTSATAFCGTAEANAGTVIGCKGEISTTGAKVLKINNAYFKERPAANDALLERVRHFSWWNIIGISNALAVGFGDFSVNLTTFPYTVTNTTPVDFEITFTPTAAGLRDGILVIEFDDGSTFEFAVSGMGTAATLTSSSSPQNIPVFGPFGLLAMLFGLLWFGNRRRKH